MKKIGCLLLGMVFGCLGYCLYSRHYSGPRKAMYPVEKTLISRWSPRAFADKPVTEFELLQLAEAARWAPSSYNKQPWHFIMARKHVDDLWDTVLNSMVPFNQSWAKNAGAFIIVLAQTEQNGQPIPSYAFDTGAAVQNMALQASSMGLAFHIIEGFDKEPLLTALELPEGYQLLVLCVVGKPGSSKDLAPELQEREKPSDRKPIADFTSHGSFKK